MLLQVAELQARFERERAINKALQRSLGKVPADQPRNVTPTLKDVTPKSTQVLMGEIAMLDREVIILEQHLLELYRQAFTRTLAWSPYDCEWLQSTSLESTGEETSPYHQNQLCTENSQDSPQGSSFWIRAESQRKKIARASSKDWTLHSSHSQPILFSQGTPYRDSLINGRQRTLAEDSAIHSANILSEDLVRCMAAIYCRLAQPPIPQHEPKFSPSSSFSASTFSTARSSSDGWTSQHKSDATYEGSHDDFQRNYTTNVAFEVQWISVDSERLAYAASMLRIFESLLKQLEGVDPGQMDHEQKLAFWINVHNALMMHAYLAYGIPQSKLKRVVLLQKASYRIGAHSINAQIIEQSILKCRSHRPGKWLQTFLSPGSKLRGEELRAYAIHHPEPLVCFALCCGGRSDPAVRVYTHKFIYHELEVAKQDFLHAHVSVRREGKVCLPSILESYAKEASLKPSQLLHWVVNNVEGEMATFIAKCTLQTNGKAHRYIEWLQYDFTFRYAFVHPLAI
eukprot:c21524_g1_i4 orf=623-2161(+)